MPYSIQTPPALLATHRCSGQPDTDRGPKVKKLKTTSCSFSTLWQHSLADGPWNHARHNAPSRTGQRWVSINVLRTICSARRQCVAQQPDRQKNAAVKGECSASIPQLLVAGTIAYRWRRDEDRPMAQSAVISLANRRPPCGLGPTARSLLQHGVFSFRSTEAIIEQSARSRWADVPITL